MKFAIKHRKVGRVRVTDRDHRIWIVEMWINSYRRIKPRWEPTVGAALNRREALQIMADWKQNNSYDRFRLKLYRRVR